VSQLLRQLRESGAVDDQALQSAMRRQQIYGGSLDTVLLELDLIEAHVLDAQLAAANRCGSVPVAVLEPGPERPWDALPRELVDLGWTMPLRRHLGRIQVAVHPEIPDERRALLERSVEHVEVLVTCEAGLAKLAAERTGSVMPQRYAVLALKWLHALRKAEPKLPEPEHDAPRIERPVAAPWMTAPQTAPHKVPSPQELALRKGAEPRVGEPRRADAAKPNEPEKSPQQRSPTFLYGLPVDDDDATPASSSSESAASREPSPAPEPTPTPEPEPIQATPIDVTAIQSTAIQSTASQSTTSQATASQATTARDTPVQTPPPASEPLEPSHHKPLMAALPIEDDDGFVDPLAGLDDDAPSKPPPRFRPAAAKPPPAQHVAPPPPVPTPEPPASRPGLAERLAGPRSALEDATGRDQATDALVRAAMVLSPRVALFGIKKEGLRGLPSPGEIPDVVEQLVEISPAIEAAIEGREPLDLVTDLDLRMVVGQEAPVPCLFLPVSVQNHAVLMLYVDRGGGHFSVEEVEAGYELCELAGRTLEGVLMRLRSPSAVSPANAKVETTPTPASAIPPIPPIRPAQGSSLFAPPSLPGFPAKPASGPMFAPPAIPGRPASGPVTATPIPTPPPIPPVAVPPIPTPPIPVPPPIPAPPVGSPPNAASPRATAAVKPPAIKPPLPAGALPSLPPLPTPVASDKPPVRMHRDPVPTTIESNEIDELDEVDLPRANVTPLSSPLGLGGEDNQSVRGRITLDDEDRPLGATTTADLDSAINAAMRGGSSAIVHLRSLGEAAMRRIAKLFPGELDVHRRDLDTLPPLPAHGPLIRVALELGRDLGPALIEVMDHPNPNTRFYLAFVFQELRDERAVPALGELAFDPDADVRAIAMRVLETYSAETGFETTVGLIRRELDSPNRTRQLHSTRAVGTLRDIRAVPKLIELLSSKERYIQEAALESLCSITGQQLGLKPHRWKAWYGDNAHHHRVEWIMASLAHKDLSVRRWAADELRRITGQRIMFPAAGTKQEREIGLQKWIDWWRDEGRAKMG
jgi:hypothetical protein